MIEHTMAFVEDRSNHMINENIKSAAYFSIDLNYCIFCNYVELYHNHILFYYRIFAVVLILIFPSLYKYCLHVC